MKSKLAGVGDSRRYTVVNRSGLLGIAAATFIVAGSVSANASNIWIDDVNGNIGLVDTATGTIVSGTLHPTGQIFTDIGFIGSQMYGTTFTGLFTVDRNTGTSVQIGSNYPAAVGNGMNALVGTTNVLLGASNATNTFFNVFPTNATISPAGNSPLTSAGDLAFVGSTLYESGVGAGGQDADWPPLSGPGGMLV